MKIYVRAAVKDLGDESSYVRHDIASDPNTRQQVLLQLSQDTDPYVLGGLLANPNLSHEILEQLASSRLSSVRYSLASNSRTPSDILDKLAFDEDWEVRGAVIGNWNTQADTLIALFSENDASNAMAFAHNPNTPSYILSKLIGMGADTEDNCFICFEIMYNPNVTSEIIREIVNFNNGDLINYTEAGNNLREAIILHPKTPEDVRQYVEGLE